MTLCQLLRLMLCLVDIIIIIIILTPWSRAPLEKLTGSAASQEIPRIFGTRRFLTVPTSARHLSLSWANSIQSPPPPPTSRRSILILSSHLRLGLPSGLFLSGLPFRTLCLFLLCDTSSRNTPPRRTEWGSSLPPDFLSPEEASRLMGIS